MGKKMINVQAQRAWRGLREGQSHSVQTGGSRKSVGVIGIRGSLQLHKGLYRLERQGLIRSEWQVTANNRRARYYSLTQKGRRFLNEEIAEWRRVSRAINLVLAATLESGN